MTDMTRITVALPESISSGLFREKDDFPGAEQRTGKTWGGFSVLCSRSLRLFYVKWDLFSGSYMPNSLSGTAGAGVPPFVKYAKARAPGFPAFRHTGPRTGLKRVLRYSII